MFRPKSVAPDPRLRLRTGRLYTFGLSIEGFAAENSERIREQADRLHNKRG